VSCSIDTWTATATGHDEARVIRVVGDGQCSCASCVLTLEPTNVGIVDDPRVAALLLRVQVPTEAAQVITPARVETEIKGPAVEVRVDTDSGAHWVSVTEV